MTTLQIVDNETWADHDTDLESVARELRRARAAVRSDDDEGVPQDISEAAVLNLVVASSETAHLDEAADLVGKLAQRHPSRSILFLRERRDEDRLAAHVNAVCTFEEGATRQVCFERLRLEGHGAFADQLHSIVPALVIPGVPLFVWWRGAPPLRTTMHQRLRQMSERMIVDSSGFREALSGLADEVLKCGAERCAISDLAWGRLETWREQIANLFDPADTREYLADLEQVTIRSSTGSNVYPTEAVLLLSWLASRLDWHTRSPLTQEDDRWACSFNAEGRTIECRVESSEDGEASGDQMVTGIVVKARAALFELSADAGAASVRQRIVIGGATTTESSTGMKSPDLLSLLSQELELIGSDEVYEQAVAVGATLSGRQV